MAICIELVLDDRAHLAHALNPNDGQHSGRKDADAAADQEHQLPANAQIVEEFAHSLFLKYRSCARKRDQPERRARLA